MCHMFRVTCHVSLLFLIFSSSLMYTYMYKYKYFFVSSYVINGTTLSSLQSKPYFLDIHLVFWLTQWILNFLIFTQFISLVHKDASGFCLTHHYKIKALETNCLNSIQKHWTSYYWNLWTFPDISRYFSALGLEHIPALLHLLTLRRVQDLLDKYHPRADLCDWLGLIE